MLIPNRAIERWVAEIQFAFAELLDLDWTVPNHFTGVSLIRSVWRKVITVKAALVIYIVPVVRLGEDDPKLIRI